MGNASVSLRRTSPGLGKLCTRPLLRALVCCALGFLPFSFIPAAQGDTVRVRMAWSNPTSRAQSHWRGRISVEDGTFSDLRLLGFDGDAASTIWLENNEVLIATERPHSYDGFDVTVEAPDDATLRVTLLSEHAAEPAVFSVPLSEVKRGAHSHALDSKGTVLWVQRTPGDELRLAFARDQLIYEPGDQFAFSVRPDLVDLTLPRELIIKAEIRPARTSRVLWSSEETRVSVTSAGSTEASFSVPLSLEEFEDGVYSLRIIATDPPGYSSQFFGTRQLAVREVQFVVFDSQAAPVAEPVSWRQVFELDPTSQPWWKPRLPVLREEAPPPSRTLSPDGGYIQLPPRVEGQEPSWQAYRLTVDAVGKPHMLEVEYPTDGELQLGLSILEPNAAGQVESIGRDFGVHIDPYDTSAAPSARVHRLLFWPRSRTPLLLVTNQHAAEPARFGRIRVLQANGDHAAARRPVNRGDSPRLIAAYLSRPLLPEVLGASDSLDPKGKFSVDDWQSFYEGATRLADYVEYAGYNAAIVSVMADGSCTYPSRLVATTPLHDTETLRDGGADLPQKDVLELLLREFDRRGLSFMPAIQLAAPLPELERLRKLDAASAVGIVCIGPDGTSWPVARGSTRGLAVHYNLTDDRVQTALRHVVAELVENYGHHRSFSGVAVQLAAESFAVLPTSEWCLDDRTIARFEADTGIVIGGGDAQRFRNRAARLAQGEHATAWLNWRAAKVSRFYSSLAEVVRQGDADRHLVLLTEHLFDDPQIQGQLRPGLPNKSPEGDRLMLEMGIDAASLTVASGISLLSPTPIAPEVPLTDRALDLQLQSSLESKASLFAGSLLHLRPQRVPLADFKTQGPFGADKTRSSMSLHSVPDGNKARKFLADAVASQDALLIVVGGSTLAIGQEEATRGSLETIAQLPSPESEIDADRQQPVLVRTYGGEDTVVALVNQSPWHVTAHLTITVPQQSRTKRLGPPPPETSARRDSSHVFNADTHIWPVLLEPYEVQATRFDVPGVEVNGVAVEVDPAAREELQSRVEQVLTRDWPASKRNDTLENPGFEPLDGSQKVPGWRALGPGGSALIELDATQPFRGTTSLYLDGRPGHAGVESGAIAAPPTGRLDVRARIRARNVEPQTEVRIVLAWGTGPGESVYTALGGARPNSQPLPEQWGYYQFAVDELPLDTQARVQLRFEVLGPGEVWIDEVELLEPLFDTDDKRLDLLKMTRATEKALDEDRFTECLRRLDSYWPRFLAEYMPAKPAAVVDQSSPAATGQSERSVEAPQPSIGRRAWEALQFWRR